MKFHILDINVQPIIGAHTLVKNNIIMINKNCVYEEHKERQ